MSSWGLGKQDIYASTTVMGPTWYMIWSIIDNIIDIKITHLHHWIAWPILHSGLRASRSIRCEPIYESRIT